MDTNCIPIVLNTSPLIELTVPCKGNESEIRRISSFFLAKIRGMFATNFRWVKRNFALILAKFRIHGGEISFWRNFAWAKNRISEISAKWNFAVNWSEDGRLVIIPFVRIVNLWYLCLLKQSLQIDRSSVLAIDKPAPGESWQKKTRKTHVRF